jgi:hypothetical protein
MHHSTTSINLLTIYISLTPPLPRKYVFVDIPPSVSRPLYRSTILRDNPTFNATTCTTGHQHTLSPPVLQVPDPTNYYPRISEVNKQNPTTVPPSTHNSIGRKDREAFIEKMLPTRISAMLNQNFGKENISQCFSAEACLRHILLPLYKHRFLTKCDWTALQSIYPPAQLQHDLLTDHADINIRPL